MNNEHAKRQIIDKASEALAGRFSVLSTGEKLAVAMALNRADWLAESGYTMAEAIDRLRGSFLDAIPAASRELATREEQVKYTAEERKVDTLLLAEPEQAVDIYGAYVTHGYAPGYRDVRLHFDVKRHGRNETGRVVLCLNPADSLLVSADIVRIHQSAWQAGGTPLDAREGETCPSWVGDE